MQVSGKICDRVQKEEALARQKGFLEKAGHLWAVVRLRGKRATCDVLKQQLEQLRWPMLSEARRQG